MGSWKVEAQTFLVTRPSKQWGDHYIIRIKDRSLGSSSQLSVVTTVHLLLGYQPQEDGNEVSYIHQCDPRAQHRALAPSRCSIKMEGPGD